MKSTVSLLAAALLLFSPALAGAQTRTRRSTTVTQKRRSTAAPTRTNSDAVAVGRIKVADRIKLITEFLYVYGGIANEVERTEAQARASNSGGADLSALANRSKAALRNSLADVRAGLDQLELDFRSSPDLQRYYDRLAGVAAAAADAEELAASNQLKPAGRKLLVVVNQLTDTLAAMN